MNTIGEFFQRELNGATFPAEVLSGEISDGKTQVAILKTAMRLKEESCE